MIINFVLQLTLGIVYGCEWGKALKKQSPWKIPHLKWNVINICIQPWSIEDLALCCVPEIV